MVALREQAENSTVFFADNEISGLAYLDCVDVTHFEFFATRMPSTTGGRYCPLFGDLVGIHAEVMGDVTAFVPHPPAAFNNVCERMAQYT